MEDDLRVQVARLEERMNTMQAEYKTDIALLAEQLAERDARLAERDVRLAERDARLAEQRGARDARLLGGVLGIIGLGLVVLGFLIRLG